MYPDSSPWEPHSGTSAQSARPGVIAIESRRREYACFVLGEADLGQCLSSRACGVVGPVDLDQGFTVSSDVFDLVARVMSVDHVFDHFPTGLVQE